MKMPEGWNRIAKAVVTTRKWEDEARPGDRAAIMDGAWCGDIHEALTIIRDMATVLYNIQITGTEERYVPEEGKHDIFLNGYAVEAKIILNRFNEWK